LVCKEEQFTFDDLPFNLRWRKDYYIEKKEDQDPDTLSNSNDRQEENEPTVKIQ